MTEATTATTQAKTAKNRLPVWPAELRDPEDGPAEDGSAAGVSRTR